MSSEGGLRQQSPAKPLRGGESGRGRARAALLSRLVCASLAAFFLPSFLYMPDEVNRTCSQTINVQGKCGWTGRKRMSQLHDENNMT